MILLTAFCTCGLKGFCQIENNYERVTSIENTKQDSLRKLILLYRVKEEAERNHLQKDSGYIFALLKIASYENALHGDAAAALTYTWQALQLLQSLDHPLPYLFAYSYFNLGIFYYILRSYDQSKIFFDKAIDLSAKEHLQKFYFQARLYRAAVDDLSGDFEKAGKSSQLAMAEAEDIHDSVSYMSLLYMHCRAMSFQNELQSALSEAKQLELRAKSAHSIFFLANAYNLQAAVCQALKNYEGAEQLFKLAFSTRLSLSDYESTSIDCNNLALLYASCLHDYKQANMYFEKSILFGNKCPQERQARVFMMTYGNLGNLYAGRNDFSRAAFYYNKAFEVVKIRLPDILFSNPSLRQLSAIGEKNELLSILSSKCGLLLKLFKTTNNHQYLQQCINTAITTDSLIVQMRHEQTGDNSKLYWRDQTHNFFSEAMEACYLSGNIEKAVFLMEKSRSVLLNDKLNELSSTSAHLPPQMALAEYKMITDIMQLQAKLAQAPASSSGYTDTLRILEKKQNELNRYIQSLEKKYPLYYQYKYADDVPSLTDIIGYLSKTNQSLVYYFAGDSAIYVLGITTSGTRFLKIPSASFDSHLLSQFSDFCSNRQESNRNYPAFSSLAHTIYKNLFEPLHLPAGNVIICTDNFFIPFDALCSDEKGKHFLLYDYNFSYTYSARTLLKPLESKTKPEGDFIGFAPVTFAKNLDVFPLHRSASALQAAAGFYERRTLFTTKEATRNCFFKQASRYAVLTIFSHAQADTSDKEPVLYMQDSLVHLSELQQLHNPATQFVLLSACQTNTGKSANGEGIYSLARGFAAAGVPSVSATLWKADEEAIYSISAKFNEHLSQGMNKSEALRQAKIWYLQNSDLEHALPFYWANLVLIGSPDPIAFSQPDHNWIWIASATLFLLCIVLFVVLKNRKRKTISNIDTNRIILQE